jgi:hypothetical protein
VPTTRTHATLRIFHEEGPGSAAGVTRSLGVEPTRSHEAGERRTERDPRPWPKAMWSLDSGLPWERQLDEHLTALCDVLGPKREALRRLAEEEHQLDWFCFVEVQGGQGGIALGPDLLLRMAELPVALDLDIYVSSDARGPD